MPDIEEVLSSAGVDLARARIRSALAEDYDDDTPDHFVRSRNWFGRCVWESDNDVVDDQVVFLDWPDRPHRPPPHHLARSASIHVVATSEAVCLRRGRIYGSSGEISYDSRQILLRDFVSRTTYVCHHPPSVNIMPLLV